MSRIGLVNCYIDARGYAPPAQTSYSPITVINQGAMVSHVSNEMFVTLYNFLNSAQAQSIGIHRRAYYSGIATANLLYPMPEDSPAGSGMNYWDEVDPAGNHAWALFEFTLGSPSFWLLLQWGASQSVAPTAKDWNDTTAFSFASLGIPYLDNSLGASNLTAYPSNASTRLAGVGIAVAMMNDGSSPWNGTTNNNGADVKGSPVWNVNSMVWPRPNSQRGQYVSEKNLMFGLLYEQNVNPKTFSAKTGSPQLAMSQSVIMPAGYVPRYDQSDILYHLILEEDKICLLIDQQGIGHYDIFYYGPFVPLTSGSITPRIALHKFNNNNDDAPILTLQTNQVYGGFDSGYINALSQSNDQVMNEASYFQGGVTHPLLPIVAAASLDMLPFSLFDNPRKLLNESVGPWSLFNPIVYMNEFPERRTLLGEITWFTTTTNCRTHTTFNTGTLVVFGNPEMGSVKVVIPWFAGTKPGTYGIRRGISV